MSAAARKGSSAGESAGVSTRRPTRAGVSARSAAAPVRRGSSRLALVSDVSADAVDGVLDASSAPITVGNTALKTAPEPRQRKQPQTVGLRLAPPAPVTVARVPFVLLTLALIVGGIVGLLLINTQINQNAFELQKLREQQSQLAAREQQLSKELAIKEAPGNLAAEAARQGMVPAGTPAYITLPDGRVINAPQPAGRSGRG
ncbi:MAG: hypothetical protein H0T78_07255 [Longispora sp.]|nr:hypothetical protein [Longispora sp. (in: high G+C Gram-positive bacteria)]